MSLQLHLHHLENSRSFRILWLLEELGLEYQMTNYQRTKSYLAPKSLEKVHPTGKAPILEVTGLDANDPEAKTALIESGFIIDYLMAKYDTEFKLHPQIDADDRAWRDYDFWMHYAEASAMPALVMRLVFSKVVERSPALIRPIAKGIRKQVEASMISKNITKALDLIEAELSEDKWFAGAEFSAADIQMAFFVEAANAGQGLDEVRYTSILNWLKRCQARPAYRAAVAKGGKLEF
ncbi:glutathione S-transferase N-terminal domain-containing protein [Psychrobacter lutiphocae]|uniref:glutathione S-transferase N-terminal domain-containing protein n=1 Tax=Psychrobacter lutiphocae TaxID=540500 RepID=UPI000372E5B3|nr:glutathione S-transferase N-terminal domain-containing protein [Psychrobacter lutiphocae]